MSLRYVARMLPRRAGLTIGPGPRRACAARTLTTTAPQRAGPGLGWSVLVGAAALSGVTGYYVAKQQTPVAQLSPPDIPTYGDREALKKAIEQLREVLPAEHVTIDEEELTEHGHSHWSYHNVGLPNVVVYPETTEQVSAIVKIASQWRIPVIPYSGGTSLEGHYTAPKGGICVDFAAHMGKVVAFHPEDMDIVVQPGIGWEALNEYLKPHGLFYPLDPGPGACIGGMIGTSCSGTNAVRYGTMKEWVLNITAVLADGTVLKTKQRSRKSAAGYDLTKLFIGAEGTLGLVTEATLKLAVLPQETTVAVCDFPTIRDAASVVPDVVRAGVQVGAVELLDEVMMKAVNLANPDLGYSAKPTLFFKFSGSKAQIDYEINAVKKLVQKHKGGKFRFAKTDKEKEELWEGRKVALWSSALLKPGCAIWTTDVCVPVSNLPDLIYETKQDLESSSLPCPMVGHVGDGNFHVFILFDRDDPNEFAEAKRLNGRLVERAIRLEGSCTGEHGVGVGKKAYLLDELGENTVQMMRTIKKALDPLGIMNPGKVIPDA